MTYGPRFLGGPTQFTPSSSPYGVTILGEQGNFLNTFRVADMRNMGIQWLRFFITWQYIESVNGYPAGPIYDWTEPDAAVALCNAAGINYDFCIANPPDWHCYGWAGPNPPPTDKNPCSPLKADWAVPADAGVFAAAVASRYDGNHGHGHIEAIECANEGYDDGPSQCQDGGFAVAVTQAIYTAVKAVAPNILVGAPAELHPQPDHVRTWIKNFYDLGGGPYCDFHQLHLYPGTKGPFVDDGIHATMQGYAQIVKDAGTSRGFNKQIWFTETGYAWQNCDGLDGPCAPLCGYEQQACLLQLSLDAGRLSGGLIDKVFLYTLAGSDGFSPVSGQSNETFHCGYYMYKGGSRLYECNSPTLSCLYPTGYTTQYPVWTGGATPPVLSVSPTTLSFSGTQGQPDPSSQTVTLSDTGQTGTAWTSAITYASGSGWLSLFPVSGTLSGSGGNQAISVTTTIGALTPGTYNGTITCTAVTGGSIATVTISLVVSAAPVGPAGTVAMDTFTRKNQTGWNTASDGSDTWGEVVGTGVLSIVSNKGVVATNTTATLVTLGTGMLCNGDYKVRFVTNNNAAQAGMVMRYVNSSNYVRCEVLNGTIRFRKNVAGTPSLLSPTASVTIANNTAYWLHVNTNGTAYNVNVWQDGGSESAGWMLSCTDTSFAGTAGQYGLFAQLATGTDTVSYDQYLAVTTPRLFFVSPLGSDSNTGSSTSPWKTFSKVASSIQAGDTVFFSIGSYSGQVTLATCGTAFALIILKSVVRWKATLVETATHGIGSYDLNITGDYLILDSFEVTGPDIQDGILLASNFSYAQNCYVHDVCQSFDPGSAGGGGIVNTVAGFAASGAIIRNNRVERIGPPGVQNSTVHGIYVQNSNPSGQGQVYNNLILNASGYGIGMYHNPNNWVVTNNTVLHCLIGGISCNGDTGSSYFADFNTIQNNILYANGTGISFPAIWSGSDNCGLHNVFRNNLAYYPGGPVNVVSDIPRSFGGTLILSTQINTALYDFTPASIHVLQTATNLPNADPLFANYQPDGTGDYHLLSMGGPAIDTGVTALSPATDFDGIARPQGSGVDVGAFEALAILTMTTGGIPVPFDEDTFHLIEKVDERQRFQVTVLDYAGTQFHPYSERVILTDPVLGRLFSGFVVDDKQDKTNTLTSVAMEHQLDIVGNEHSPGKRTSNLVYATPTYAGKIVTDMVDQVLAAEGVRAYYSTHADDDEDDFAQGTLTSVIATSNGGGDLELANAGIVSVAYTSQASWGVGTFSNTQANPGGDVSLIGATRNWDDGDFSHQTLFGHGSPTQSVKNGVFVLTCTANSESRSRLDFAGATWAGSHSATIACDFDMGGFIPFNGFTYRTTNWNDSNGSFAYAVEANLQRLYLKKGTNGGSGPVTTVASYTFSPPLSPGWYRVQVVVSSSNVHTISVNGTTYITVTDSSYTAPGYIALRELNLESYSLIQYFDNFGVMQSLSGTWTSPSTSINSITTIAASIIAWDNSLSQGGTILVQSSIDGGSTYQTCINGAAIPGLAKGVSGTGKSVITKVTLSTTTTAVMPSIENLQWSVTAGYVSSGNRTSLVPGNTPYGIDTFNRADQSGWGTASDGQTWYFDSGTGTLAIVSHTGTVTGNNTFNYMRLGTTAAGDATASVRIALGDATDENAIFLRYSNASNHYRAYLGNTNQIVIERKVGGQKKQLAAAPFPLTVGPFYWLRFQAQANVLFARAWSDGSPEPGTWALIVTDSSFANGNFGLFSAPGSASVVTFDHMTVTSIGVGVGLDLTPVGQLGSSVIAWTATLPIGTSLGVDVSLDSGTTWTDISGQNGGPIPGINGQPEPTTDTFATDTSSNYTSTLGTGGLTSLTLFGTNVAAATLTTAGQLTANAGGTEASASTRIGSSLGYGELTALGTTSPWPAGTSLPAQSGQGWLFDTTALEGKTFVAGSWGLAFTSRYGSSSGQTFGADFYGVLSLYDSVHTTYSTQGTFSLPGQSPGSNTKAILTFPNLSLAQVGVTTGKKVYIGLFPNVTSSTLGGGSNAFVYESNSASAGVPGDIQLVTPGYVPTGNASLASWAWDIAHSRVIASGGQQAVLALNAAAFANIDLLTDMDMSDAGGLVWCFIDSNDFYALQIGDNQSSVGTPNTATLFRTTTGITVQVGQAHINFPRGTYHRVRAATNQGTITITFDGTPVITYVDGSPLDIGTYGLYQNGGTARFYQLWSQPLGDNVTGMTVDTRLRLATTDSTVTPQVLSLTLAAFGPQIEAGALIPTVAYQHTFCGKNLDDLAKRSNYSWWIDQNNVLYFTHRQGLPAPWIAQSNKLGLPSDIELDSNLLVDVAGDVYRNRQTLTGVTNVATFTDSFVGDGTATSFTLRYPIIATTVPPTILLDGTLQKVGLKGTSGSQWYYASSDATIAQDTGESAISVLDTLTVTYVGSFADTVTVNNEDAQQALAKIEGGTGIVEDVLDVSSPGMLYDAAVDYANALLTRNCVVDGNTNLPTGRTFTYATYRNGLQVGMIQPAFLPEEGLFDSQMLITQIDVKLKTQPNNTRLYQYIVQISELPRLASIGKLLSEGLLTF